MNWSTMTPDERNTLVAERVMDWTAQPCDLESQGGELTIYSSGDACCPRCGAYAHISSLEHEAMPPPRYSEHLDAAWTIAERHGHVLLDVMRKADKTLVQRAQFITSERVFSAEATTAPEALCLAALRQCGVEIKP